MKYLLAIPLAFFLSACSGEAGQQSPDSNEPIRITSEAAADMSMSDMADQLIEDSQLLTTLLSGVNDAATAEAIRPQIETLVDNYDVMLTRFENSGEPSFSEMASLASRLPDLAETQKALSAEVKRIYQNHPEATEVLRETLEDVRRPQTP